MATQHDNKCPNCGDAVDPGVKFCGSCGSKVSVQTFTGAEAAMTQTGSKVSNITCPGCGEAWSTSQKTCGHCGRPVVITTFNSVYDMPMPMVSKYANDYRQQLAKNPDSKELNTSVAFCFLKLKQYDHALNAFEKAKSDFDNAEVFFYAAVCRLGGKKAFLAQRPTIDKIEEDINSALMLEPSRGIFHYFLAYIKYDYYSRKFFNTSPTWQEALSAAQSAGESPSPVDIEQFYGTLGVDRPVVL